MNGNLAVLALIFIAHTSAVCGQYRDKILEGDVTILTIRTLAVKPDTLSRQVGEDISQILTEYSLAPTKSEARTLLGAIKSIQPIEPDSIPVCLDGLGSDAAFNVWTPDNTNYEVWFVCGNFKIGYVRNWDENRDHGEVEISPKYVDKIKELFEEKKTKMKSVRYVPVKDLTRE